MQEEKVDNSENIGKLREQLELKMSDRLRIEKLNLLRYYLSGEEKEEDKVIYNKEKDKLIYSESIQIAIVLINRIEEILNEEVKSGEADFEYLERLDEISKENYYYLARYLYSYYAIAIEFGIPKAKQFLAPRRCVLDYVNWELTKFYYKDRAIMTISMPQGTGKEQPLSSKILTPEGWTTMGELKVGSKVIAASGNPTKVTGIYPKGVKDVYRVTFDDHTYVECGLEHLWEVKTREDRHRKREARVVNTEQMLLDFKIKKDDKIFYNNYSVRLVKPVEFINQLKKEDISPYVLGTLIANGNFSQSNTTFCSTDEEVVEKVKKELNAEDVLVKYSTEINYGIKKKEDVRNEKGYYLKSKTREKINEYGLGQKKSEEKFIPKKYLYSSIKNRIELLRGLMDNDGYVHKREGKTVYITTSYQLCLDFIELIRGLGGKASYSIKEGSYKKDNIKIKCKDVYQICFALKINPFYSKKKSVFYKEPNYNYQKMIVNIEKVRQEKCQCIMVEDEEHLYVTDGYTLTHNTEDGKRFMSFCVGKAPDLPNMFVSYSAAIAKDKGYNGIMTLLEDENGNFQKIFPNLKIIYKNAETMSIDCRDDGKKKPHSEYTLYCAGFDGSITGRTRAHGVLYVDDLVKNIEEARNKDVMDKKWEEFTGTLKKRMQGQCKLLIIGTVFSISDPLSRIIEYYKQKAPDRIKVIKIPRIE